MLSRTRLSIVLVLLTAAVRLSAQTSVRGTVTGPSGEALAGVFVMEQGTQNGALTDTDGGYVLHSVKDDAQLLFTCIGYREVSVALSGRTVVDVKMEEDALLLDDVVVIGYGQTTRKEVTGSVASLKSEDFVTGSNSSPYDLINGKIAGLNIIKGDGGDPNGSISIQLRGTTSMSAGATPLVIIDNVIGGSLDAINPEEIESIDVLKDGSAAAIYGTRGTNGVILITTKKGASGDNVNIDFSTYASVQTVSRKLRMLTAEEFRSVMASGHTGFDGGADTDWLDAVTRRAPVSQYYNLAISGGVETCPIGRPSRIWTDRDWC